MKRTSLLMVSLVLAGGCRGVVGTVPHPDPVPVLELDAASEKDVATTPVVAYLTPPPGELLVDRLLASPVMRDPTFQEEVADWIDYWRSAATPWFPDFVRRMGSFEQTVDSALAGRAMPPSLRYLPLIESGYNPGARSRASAVGMWQFMAGTARDFGMEVGPFVDERRDPFKSTAAAVEYLDRLHGDFGSWFLALAAYNGGPNRARRILREQAPVAPHSDSLFWALRQHFPRETREFVPKLVGAIIVAQSPTRYGYELDPPNPPFRFDRVTVPEATTVDVLALAAEVDEAEMRRLNPELYRGFTPPGVAYAVRVPEGRAELFAVNYASIPASERLTVVEHAVAQGETLSHIAERYGVSVAELRAANPGIRPRYLRVGARLTVPIMVGSGGAG
jgi:membrane-bound lytic murein transglycosylase D